MSEIKEEEAVIFTATDTSTSTNAVHEYSIDWDALSQGGNGVTLQIDSDGDGTFESTVYLSATGEEAGEEGTPPLWLWPVIGLMAALLVLVAAVIYRLKFKQHAIQIAKQKK